MPQPATRVTGLRVCPTQIPGVPPLAHVGRPILPLGRVNVLVG